MAHNNRVLVLTAGLLVPTAAWAQQSSTVKPASAVALGLIASVEKAITGVAQEMPDDKYEFVPTTGAFRGVRTFSKQIKHAAALQFYVANTMLGKKVTANMAEGRGPEARVLEIAAALRSGGGLGIAGPGGCLCSAKSRQISCN